MGSEPGYGQRGCAETALEERGRVGPVVPFVGIGDGDGAGAEGEFRSSLVAGGLGPPIPVGEAPPGPFGDPVEIDVAVAVLVEVGGDGVGIGDRGDELAVVDRPAAWGRVGPRLVRGEGFVLVGAQRDGFEVFGEAKRNGSEDWAGTGFPAKSFTPETMRRAWLPVGGGAVRSTPR